MERKDMVTVEDGLTILETEFRTELKHLVTKADLKDLEMRLIVRLGGLLISGLAATVAMLKLWN